MAKTSTAAKSATAAKNMPRDTRGASANNKQQQPSTDMQEQNTPMLQKLFTDMLKDMLWAERHLVTALNTMRNVATTQELQDAFEDHIFVTQKHEDRLLRVFSMLGKDPEAKKCDAMEGLTKEAMHMIEETKPGSMTRDAALVIAAQKVEHYEIASYGSLVQIARTIDKEQIARILEKTLWEEEDTDQLLTNIAESSINPLADDEGTPEEEEATETA